jgi:hypothetical protein
VAYLGADYSSGADWAVSLCRDAPVVCANWKTFGYAASTLLVSYLALQFWAL